MSVSWYRGQTYCSHTGFFRQNSKHVAQTKAVCFICFLMNVVVASSAFHASTPERWCHWPDYRVDIVKFSVTSWWCTERRQWQRHHGCYWCDKKKAASQCSAVTAKNLQCTTYSSVTHALKWRWKEILTWTRFADYSFAITNRLVSPWAKTSQSRLIISSTRPATLPDFDSTLLGAS